MGNSKSKAATELNDQDFQFLVEETGFSPTEVRSIFESFMQNNTDGNLDQKEFFDLYNRLSVQPLDVIEKKATLAFKTFDKDKSGKITFYEFIIAYALTHKGDPVKKLDYVFGLYDTNNNNILDLEEAKAISSIAFDLIDPITKEANEDKFFSEIKSILSTNSNNGVIKKDDFINKILENEYLKSIIFSPE